MLPTSSAPTGSAYIQTVVGSKAYANKLPLVGGTFGPRSIQCIPFVVPVLLSNTLAGQNDAQGRPIYVAEDGTESIGYGLTFAFNALFNATNNPYTYGFNGSANQPAIVDAGGYYGISFYTVYNENGWPDPQGAQPQNVFFPLTPQQIRSLTDYTVPIIGGAGSFAAAPYAYEYFGNRGISRNNTRIAGAMIGVYYKTGGNDPAIGNLHWLQIISTNFPDAPPLYGGPKLNDLEPNPTVVISDILTGMPLYWTVDNMGYRGVINNKNYLDVSYDGISPYAASNLYFLDIPGSPYQNITRTEVFNGITQSVTAAFPGETAPNTAVSYFYLFKMFYTDFNGLPTASPDPSGTDIIGITVMRQGLMYGYIINNLL